MPERDRQPVLVARPRATEPRGSETGHPHADPASRSDTTCECCGTERRREDPILCVVCGEPALGEEWTP